MAAEEGLTPDEAERLLTGWAASFGDRDLFVLTAHRAGVSKHRIHLLTGIARTTLDRILSKESIMAIGTEVQSPQQETVRQRTIAALLDSGLTIRDALIYLGTDPVVIIQLNASGTDRERRAVAAKLISSFKRDGLCLRQEPNGLIADEAYLASGSSAEVHELR
jgi:hypothetical protein